jgi:hypothetical protein
MTSSDDLQVPRDPGPVPAPLRDAFAWTRDAARASDPVALPDDAALEQLSDDSADDAARLATIEQLLSSAEGARVLAHVVAARVAARGVAMPVTSEPARDAQHSTPIHLRGVRSRRRPGAGLKPLLLAASLMLVAGTSWFVLTQPRAGDELRDGSSTVELNAVQPGGARAPITLTWKALRPDARYTVEVLDTADAPVFSTETTATRTALPVGLLKPGTYRWYVRARGMDRTEIRSRVETFVIKP